MSGNRFRIDLSTATQAPRRRSFSDWPFFSESSVLLRFGTEERKQKITLACDQERLLIEMLRQWAGDDQNQLEINREHAAWGDMLSEPAAQRVARGVGRTFAEAWDGMAPSWAKRYLCLGDGGRDGFQPENCFGWTQ
jgi:hypothetical protein